eukprot:COSAG02_NODE_270_length_26392_cov_29.151980_18_plen_79_part_01
MHDFVSLPIIQMGLDSRHTHAPRGRLGSDVCVCVCVCVCRGGGGGGGGVMFFFGGGGETGWGWNVWTPNRTGEQKKRKR